MTKDERSSAIVEVQILKVSLIINNSVILQGVLNNQS